MHTCIYITYIIETSYMYICLFSYELIGAHEMKKDIKGLEQIDCSCQIFLPTENVTFCN